MWNVYIFFQRYHPDLLQYKILVGMKMLSRVSKLDEQKGAIEHNFFSSYI